MAGKSLRGSLVAAALVLTAGALLLGASEAEAKKPGLGRWEGTAEGGAQLSFRVMRVKGSHKRAATYAAYGCPAREVPLSIEWWRDSITGPQGPGDTSRVHAFRIDRHGRFRDQSYEPDLRGDLGKRSGHVRVDVGETFGEAGLLCEVRKARIRVRQVKEAVTPASGVWRGLGSVGTDFRFEVFGGSLNLWSGQVLSGMGQARGAPVPCITPLGFIGAGSAPAWINAGGAFSMVDDYVEPDTISGQFDSQTSLTGRYFVHTPPLEAAQLDCVDFEQPFSASLEEPTPPPRLHGKRLVGGDAGPQAPPPPPPPLPTPTQPTQYVALGDSYSSGEGVPPFFGLNKRCHRSTRAYAQQLSPPGYTMQTSLLACSGAKTINVGRLQEQGWTAIPQRGEPTSQLETFNLETWRPVDLITITIGGNDAKFSNVVGRCIFTRRCHKGKAARRVKERIAQTVPGDLSAAYAAIRSRVPIRKGPNATVVVLGYPQLFPDELRRRCTIKGRVIPRGAQRFLRERAEQLNNVIEYVASLHNFHYVGVAQAFEGHEICGLKRSWLHGLKVPKLKYSYHPTGRGQRAYHDALVAYFSCLHQSPFGFRPSGVPFNPGNGLVVPPQCVTR